MPEEQFIFEVDYDLDDKGNVREKAGRISLLRNIRFAFAIFAKANGLTTNLDVSSAWWQKLRAALRVRDRLSHPKYPSDLVVAPQEVISAIQAKAGFDETLHGILNDAAAEQ